MTESNPPTPTVLEQMAIDNVEPIVDELLERLEVELTEKDRVAVGTAISKAIIKGTELGAAATVGHVIEQHGIEVPIDASVEETLEVADVWAEKYGRIPGLRRRRARRAARRK
jgi:hypothetical protein